MAQGAGVHLINRGNSVLALEVADDQAGFVAGDLRHIRIERPFGKNRAHAVYLFGQAIVLGLKGMKIEDRAKEIIQYLGRLQGDFTRFRDEFAVLGKHVGHAQASYLAADRRLEQFGQKFLVADGDQRELFDSDGRPERNKS